VNALLHDMERAGIEVVNLICDHRRSTTIVEFESANRADASPESAKRS